MESETEARHSCLKLELTQDSSNQTIFVKGTWFPSRFSLSITDGYDSWLCTGTLSNPLLSLFLLFHLLFLHVFDWVIN